MANTIPANQLVNVQPGVVGTGGSALSLNSVILTQSDLLPANTVVPFSTAKDVTALFGVESPESEVAAIYFKGFTGANIKPGVLYFIRYLSDEDLAAAWVRGASLNISLSQLRGLSGSISLEVDGNTRTASNINFGSASSFSAAADAIETALGVGVQVTYNSLLKAFQINSGDPGANSSISFATGSLAEALGFTEQTGAVLSQGAEATTPAGAMDNVVAQTQNWATFMTLLEPDFDTKLEFANWVNNQNLRYAYVMWDSDIAATQSNAGSIGAYLLVNEFEGTIPVYDDYRVAAFVCGTAASIDFTEHNGRITFAFKGQPGLLPSVTNATVADNLLANGYNFYGAYATATQQFNLFQNGQITGKWRWADAYINQIYLNSQLQQAILNMLSNIKSLPYNEEGYGLIRAACLDPINEALNFGAIRAGIPLSEAQSAEINNDAGLKIDRLLSSIGWYLQILPASAQTRGNRTSPPMKLWYTDGGSIQQINLASIDVM